MKPAISARRKGEQGGYALLLVLLMAAFIAINLYMEAPRVAFQAQRQKEQMLMERGEQYKRAIGLFLRTNKSRWPNSIDELENFNNRRSLRKRYIDPMTGKDEWRLIHIVNGVLTDSVTNKKQDTQDHLSKGGSVMELAGIGGLDSTGQPGVNAANRRRASEGGSQVGPDGQPIAGGTAGMPPLPGGASGTPGLPPIPGAGGTTGATGVTGVAGGPPGFGGNNGIPGMLGIPTAPTGASGAIGGSAPVSYGLGNGIAAVGGGTPVTAPSAGALPGNLSGGGVQAGFNGGFGTTPGMPGAAGATPGANGINISPQAQAAAANLIQGLLTQPRPGGMAGLPTQGVGIGGSGIAGVASKAEGESIMVYNDRSSYNEWEFIYDPMKFAVPMNPNTGSTVGTPASQLASGATTGPNILNQVGTPASNLSAGTGMSGGLGMGAQMVSTGGLGAGTGGASLGGGASFGSGASLGSGASFGGASSGGGTAPGGSAAGGAGASGGSSAFGAPGASLSIRPGKP